MEFLKRMDSKTLSNTIEMQRDAIEEHLDGEMSLVFGILLEAIYEIAQREA